MGCFDECLLLLSYQFEESYEFATNFIKKLAEENDRGVRAFLPDK
jgi:hypothetical protein